MVDDQIIFPTIETERLILRAVSDEDVDFIFRHFSDPAVTEHLLDSPPPATLSEAMDLIAFYTNRKQHGPNRWCIVTKTEGTVIGTLGFHNWAPRHHRAEIGYDLTPLQWGKGYMSEALYAAIANGFDLMKLSRVEAIVYPENKGSVELLKKQGFQLEGILRKYFCLDGEGYDHALYSLLKDDAR